MIIEDGEVLALRPSELDQVWDCPECLFLTGEGEPQIDPGNPAGEMGIAAHAWARHIEDGNFPDLEDLADQHGIDVRTLEMICDQMRAFWYSDDGISHHLEGGETEIQMSMEFDAPWLSRPGLPRRIRLSGKADHIRIMGDRVNVNDWKTGMKERRCAHQMRGYGFLALDRHPQCSRVSSMISYPRLGFYDAKIWSREQLKAWMDELLTRILNGWGTPEHPRFHPGSCCAYCHRKRSCPGYRGWFADSVKLLLEGEEMDLMDNNPTHSQVARAYRRAKALEVQINEMVAHAKRFAGENDGEILPMDGTRYELQTTIQKEIDPVKAWDLLRETFSDDELLSAMTIGKGRITGIIGDRAIKNKKGRDIKAFLSKLDEADALRPKEIVKLAEIITE